MARRYKRRSYGRSKKDNAMDGLGRLLGLGLGLFAMDSIFGAIMPTIQTSTFFGTVVTLINALIPVFGILGAYFIIRKQIKNMNL